MRDKERIDYRILSNTGERIINKSTSAIDSSSTKTSVEFHSGEICINMENGEWELKTMEESLLSEEIADFMDQNPVMLKAEMSIYNELLSKVKNLRCKYRRIHKELTQFDNDYDDLYGKDYAIKMNDMKMYIKCINMEKQDLLTQENDSKQRKENVELKSIDFKIDEANRLITELEQVYGVDLKVASDNDVKRQRDE